MSLVQNFLGLKAILNDIKQELYLSNQHDPQIHCNMYNKFLVYMTKLQTKSRYSNVPPGHCTHIAITKFHYFNDFFSPFFSLTP